MEAIEGFAGKPVCGVVAVAIAAEVSFEVARAACRMHMGAGRQRFGGRTNHKQRVAALSSLAVRYVELQLKPCTLQAFVEQRCKPGVRYMVRVTGHVVIVKDGNVCDQYGVKPLSQHKSRRQRATHFVEIIGKGWPTAK